MEKISKISYIIPVYNEEENLQPLLDDLTDVAEKVSIPFEIIFIDDASTDDSLKIIKSMETNFEHIKHISFQKNCGQSAALHAGFLYATGDVIITMDADLQNDPHDIPGMLEYYGEYDLVNGWRADRQDSLWKKIGSFIGNSVRNMLTNENIHDTGCSLKVMRASLVSRLKMFRGLHRFLPTLLKLEGASVIEVKVNHRPRRHGQSKYSNMSRAFSGLYDLLAVRWMINRQINIHVKESNIDNVKI